MYLRHVPLLIAREMARHNTHKKYVAETLSRIIQRPDELTEFLAIYWQDGKQPLAAQVKKGLAAAFQSFNEYALAKYNQANAIKLKDVLFLCHAKPKDKAQEDLWKRLIDGELETPDTWEVALSSGANKKDTWTRLLEEKKLGGLAFLRNLHNMTKAGIDNQKVKNAIDDATFNKVLPFRFIAAAKHAAKFEEELGRAMIRSLESAESLRGHTVLLVDVSGSMNEKLSGKSELTRMDAACGLAMLLREICEDISIYSFSMKLCEIAPRRTFALRDAITGSQSHDGTLLGEAVRCIYADRSYTKSKINLGFYSEKISFHGQALSPDRLIVITDEQSHDKVPDPSGRGYMINVSNNKNGVGYGPWIHVDGWSENVVRFIQEIERSVLE
jgi:60 kDa SS-A/Ro ribonucleoprotein